MSHTRDALLVGCSDYEDSEFQQLQAPAQDVEALERVLADPTIGNFTVQPLINKPSGEVRERIERFFANRKPDDLLLLYFSCHGDLDPRGRLYFVTTNTKKELPESTGITAEWVKKQMDQSRSQRIVLLLDCCYSGAFAARGNGGKEILEQVRQLGGRGRVVITASGKAEHAYGSRFTNAVVRGLETGEADLNEDGRVSVSELYQYVYDKVSQDKPNQKPTMTAHVQGQLYLANNPRALLPLPAELEQALTSEIIWERHGAVNGLQRLLAGEHPVEQKRTARKALDTLRDDTDPSIRKAAKNASRRVSWQDNRNRWLVGVGLAIAWVLLVGALRWPGSGDPPPESPILPDTPACSPSVKPADGVLSLGTLLPKTGDYIYTGPALAAGVQLAMKDINDVGVIPGSVVTLDDVNQRDEGDPSESTAVKSTDALLTSEVDAIIGTATSAVALKVIDRVVCAGVIMFSPSNLSPLFTTYPDRELYFRAMPSTEVEGSVLGQLVVDDDNATAVVMSRDDEYANFLRDKIAKTIHESGRRVLDSFPYDQNALDHKKDVQRVVQRVKDKNPDAIILIGFTESARILATMIEEGLGPKNKQVYSDSANLGNTLAGQVSPQDPGVLAGMSGTLPENGGEAFVRRLREVKSGLQDVAYAAQAYDSVVIIVLAAAIAGTDAPALIAKEINGVTKVGEKCTSVAACMALVKEGKDIDYDGPSGPLEFTDSGEPSSTTYVINEIHTDGTVKPR